jgi:hypothetical protein
VLGVQALFDVSLGISTLGKAVHADECSKTSCKIPRLGTVRLHGALVDVLFGISTFGKAVRTHESSKTSFAVSRLGTVGLGVHALLI